MNSQSLPHVKMELLDECLYEDPSPPWIPLSSWMGSPFISSLFFLSVPLIYLNVYGYMLAPVWGSEEPTKILLLFLAHEKLMAT